MTSVLIVGAGPAGLAAAAAARRRGATVRVLDSAERTGGQYWRHLPASRPLGREAVLHHQWAAYQSLRDELERDPGCTIDTQTDVWALERRLDGRVRLNLAHGDADGTRRTESVVPDRLVLATGAHDRTLPVPGWTLPGVFTAGAAQAMAKGERIAVGERVVVAGAGPFLLPVTASLGQAGSRVVGVYEASRLPRVARHWLARPWELAGVSHKVGELAGYVAHHVRGRVPYHLGQGVIAIHGVDRVEAVTVADLDDQWAPIAGTERHVECDAVCLGHGFTPRLELAVAAGCELTAERFVGVDAEQRTSVDDVYAAGEITAIGGVDLALAEGELAGWAAAGGTSDDAQVRRARRARARFSRFADRIAAAHPVGPGWPIWLQPDTVVCRCEDVDAGTLDRVAAATSSVGLRSLKLTTRAGLGLCQGRVCGRTVEQLLSGSSGCAAFADGASTDRRPIAAPLRIGDLARAPQSTEAPPHRIP
jgi:NADPH-dependent 2,4-dienoyl-CoA reductase/sulfur reductase-like enzyme